MNERETFESPGERRRAWTPPSRPPDDAFFDPFLASGDARDAKEEQEKP